MEKTQKRKKVLDSAGDLYDASGQKKPKQEDLEVTGVSRSGRVRKKSSKLMDFESPDEIDNRYKRKNERELCLGEGPVLSTPAQRGRRPHVLERPHQVNIKMEPSLDHSDTEETMDDMMLKLEPPSSESDSETGLYPPAEGEGEDESSVDSIVSDGDDDVDEEGGLGADTGRLTIGRSNHHEPTPSQAQSLYMLEKSTKKKLIIRDGKIVGRMKAQRKDKGKTRFTAYMLWAKEIRQEILKVNPDMDFATMSKRLGELWATVPTNEKYNWKRRAKRLAVKGVLNTTSLNSIDTTRWKAPPSRSKFLNRAGGRAAAAAAAAVAVQAPAQVSPQQASGGGTSPISPTEKPGKGGLVAEPVVGPGLYKVVGTQPVDVAAHLRLLGESLSIIGERLKEHEGQIAVSGSLSVLLDSLLCCLGPLVCLTQQVPETNGVPQETLNKILDNIAYFMPGL